MTKTKKRVLLAMSGGIDSSVAAYLLQQQGYEVVGLTLKVWSYEHTYGKMAIDTADSEYLTDAKELAEKLGITHYTLDIQDLFSQSIMEYFIEEYLAGRTPNPCVMCNPSIKWGTLLQQAEKLKCEMVATGHYARIKEQNGRYFIVRGADSWKEQSYVLWRLSQEALSKTLFPLGNLTKTEVRAKALELGLTKLTEKSESFDVCFIPNGDYRLFISNKRPDLCEKLKNGIICNKEGKCLGHHKGYPFYTIGQRKGLEVAVGHPIYVTHIDPINNQVILGEKEELITNKIVVHDYHFQKYKTIEFPYQTGVKIRYKDHCKSATITMQNETLVCHFEDPVMSPTPGQSAVFYEGDDLLGGGIIQ